MSHLSRIKTRMVEREYLLKALEEAGYRYETGSNLSVKSYDGEKVNVDVKISGKLFSSAIGFQKKEKGYECVADWWGVRGISQKDFLQKITQRYAYHAALTKLEAQGFSLVSEDLEEGNRIHLKLRRVA
ncbi:MAG: DUF1257 domain-containing protein [bacterium]|nr:DUF1257 domain-containing protein [bacterium]